MASLEVPQDSPFCHQPHVWLSFICPDQAISFTGRRAVISQTESEKQDSNFHMRLMLPHLGKALAWSN